MGREAMQSEGSKDLLVTAAESGHVEVMQYLSEQPYTYDYDAAMETAICGDHLNVVKFILRQLSRPGESLPARGHLAVVKWLTVKCSAPCSVDAMDLAAQHGHLEVVQWLHENRSEGCTMFAMDYAARHGHLEVVQWLHANRSEGCTTNAMDLAAKEGHLNVAKWLYENRSEGCTSQAMWTAVLNGDVRCAYWLFTKFPQYNPRNALCGPGQLGMMLFQSYLTSSSKIDE